MDEDQGFPGITKPLSPLALTLSFSPLLVNNHSLSDDSSDGRLDRLDDSVNVQALSSDFRSLISPDFDDRFSDVAFYVAGHVVPLHRCVLAARCPFFMSLFGKETAYLASLEPEEPVKKGLSKLRIDFSKLFDSFSDVGKVSYEAFMTAIMFIYSGRQTFSTVACISENCLHEACRPVVVFAIDMLNLTSVLEIGVLKKFWQIRLNHILEKSGSDEALLILKAAKLYGTDSLLSMSLHLVAISDIGKFDIEKQLPLELAVKVLDLRRSMNLQQVENLNSVYDRKSERIRKALDSDDVELVHLLLNEGDVSLDQAYALHYAVLYCNPRTVKDIVDLGIADVNFKNDRGFTPLHVAAMRRDPSILVTLLSEGADPFETTSDGGTAFNIISRIARKGNEQTKKTVIDQSDGLCLQILCQAETKGLFEDAADIFPSTNDAHELFIRLIYLENRMAVARLLFPVEAKLVADICHLKETSEFIGFRISESSSSQSGEGKVDLEQVSSSHLSISKASMAAASMPTPVMNNTLLKRIVTLQKCIIVGRKMFPGTSAVLNNFTDEGDISELTNIQAGSSKEQKQKKRRYQELKRVLEEAFKKDFETMERRTLKLKDLSHPQYEDL